MSLQRRLTLFFLLIVILPLVAAGVVVQRVVVGEVSRRAAAGLQPALDATITHHEREAAALADDLRAAVATDARLGVVLARENAADVESRLADVTLSSEDLDFLIAEGSDGNVVASSIEPPRFLDGFNVPDAPEILNSPPGTGPGYLRSSALPIQISGGRTVGRLIGGYWIDADMLLVGGRSDVDMSVVANGRIAASTARLGSSRPLEVDLEDPFEVDLDEPSRATALALGPGTTIVASTPSGPIDQVARDVIVSMVILLLLALVGILALAFVLARLITQPLEDLADGARAIAQGNYGHRIPVRSGDEVGELASAFNDMSVQLSHTISALSSSQEQMQRAVRRVGDTLRSTHDVRQILESILNTAADAVDADSAALWSFTPTRDGLYARIVRNLGESAVSRVGVGEGVVGHVAERGAAMVVPDEGSPPASGGEPGFPVAMAVPLYSAKRMDGVLTVYRSSPNRRFTRGDLETVSFLAEQGGVALENVRLHEDAQRLSLTDGLTGVWNRRYFQMQFRQVLATATRFSRPFSVLMLDLDNFKNVNDTHGHQRGDSVLIEFTERVKGVLREVDTFARYGGEEFICLLAETDVQGAITTAEKIHEVIRERPFAHGEEQALDVTVSVGVASYPQHGDTFRALVEAADQALYAAKQRGRDRVCVAEPRLRSA